MVYPSYILAIEDDSDRALMMGLYENYNKLIYKKIGEQVKELDAWPDLNQTVWLNLIDHMDTLRALDRLRLLSYAIATTENLCLNYRRDKERHPTVNFDLSRYDRPDPTDGTEQKVMRMESRDELAKVWKKLDKQTQYLLRAKYQLNLPDKVIAKNLGIKQDSVRMYLTRAREKAYKLIEERRNKKSGMS